MAERNKHYALVIDSRRCINCKACIVACREENKVPLGHSRLRINETHRGTLPHLSAVFDPEQCHHCERPSCVRVCPTGASWKRIDGVVLINDRECVGCRYCIIACPYNARFAREDLGIPEKCTYCVQRIDRGGIPACVETCPSRVRIFGDLSDPNGQLATILDTRQYRVKKPETGNGPQIFYLT